MKNFEIARQFDLMADLLEIKGENPFRIRAYRRAAQNVESLAEDVEALVAESRLDRVAGIGKDLAAKIAEYLETGAMQTVEDAKKEIPAGVVELMNVPGVGPKTAKLLYEKAGVHDVTMLEELAKAGRLKGLPGIQAKSEANILKGIAVVRRGQSRMLLGHALPLAEDLGQTLERLEEVTRLSLAGSIRRRKETVGDFDILVASEKPAKVMDAFVRLPQVADMLERGETKASVRHREGIQVDLRVVEPDAFEAALERRLPELVEITHIRGDLHDHTHASDGHHSVEVLVEKARERGYEYVVVSDHSRSATIARGLSIEALRAHVKKIRAAQEKVRGIRILAGSECDILADGAMDYPDEVLAELDIVLAAVHARFKQPREEMTRRICRALENPYVSILAHPTGRLIGERDPYDVDLEAVFRTAKAHGKAVEINCYPQRLDLNDVHARRAAELGVLIAINTDTHYLENLENVRFGVATARRAWIGPGQVINTWPLERLLPWAHNARPRRIPDRLR